MTARAESGIIRLRQTTQTPADHTLTSSVPTEAVLTREQAIAQLTAPGQPFELQTVELYGASCRAIKHAPATLRDLFEAARSEATFIVFNEERYSFEEAYQRAADIAHILVNDFGVAKGDRIAISMRNFPEWIFAFSAVTSIGAIAVAMNALWTPEEMAYGLADNGAKVLFADAERLDRLADCSPAPAVQTIAVRPGAQLNDGIVDRIKDLVIRGGENIGCGEVEAALLEHPQILEAAVYAVPDERLGEEVGATIYSATQVAESEVRDFLVPHLAKFQIPRYITISNEPLPRIASGKIFKRQLRENAINTLMRARAESA